MNATRFSSIILEEIEIKEKKAQTILKISDRADEPFSRHFSLSFARENAIRLSHGH